MKHCIFVFLLAGVLLVSGCTQEGPAAPDNGSATETYPETPAGLCSNDEYSTMEEDMVRLDNESTGKLKEAIKEKGDSALEGISDLTCLEYLSLRDEEISDISALSGLVNLKSLQLANTDVSDISPLSSLKDLESLYLSRTNVNDLSPLSSLKNLETLHISKTDISDVSPLSELTNLKTLKLIESVSTKDCKSLKETLPDAQVKC